MRVDEGAVINRKHFGMTFSEVLEAGGVLIGDKVTLEFEMSAVTDA